MNGQRLPDETDWSSALAYGTYWKREGIWFALTPNGHLATLVKHKVVENSDGTITVSPSILVSATSRKGNSVELWHGFLENGVWRTC